MENIQREDTASIEALSGEEAEAVKEQKGGQNSWVLGMSWEAGRRGGGEGVVDHSKECGFHSTCNKKPL